MDNSTLTKSQKKTFTKSDIDYCGDKADIVITIRYDDDCNNGHNSFAITGDIYKAGRRSDSAYLCGGCIHEEIEKHFPEHKHLIKWHLCSSDGPMHYLANTMYHANDKDHNGLCEGEEKQIINGRSGAPVWKAITRNRKREEIEVDSYSWVDSHTKPKNDGCLVYVPVTRIGEGKTPDIGAARNSAIWPDATLEQLQDRVALGSRLPALMEAFKTDIESLGFTY